MKPELQKTQMPKLKRLAVIGGGPAGLRAAEVAAQAGLAVTLYDGKRSVGRKFLVAGKGGLNLTHGEPFTQFVTRYSGPDIRHDAWQKLLGEFDPAALRQWAADLGVETFEASSGRIYPKALKAAPLLRRWISRLKGLGVHFEMNHHWSGINAGQPHRLEFSNGTTTEADVVIFALGGASWPDTGSDGGWLPLFQSLGIACHPLTPANCGWNCPWPPELLATAEGKPLKNITVKAGDSIATGELMITHYGLEGGAIYQLGKTLREMPHPEITIDFKPTFTCEQLIAKMESAKRDLVREATVRWKLSDAVSTIIACREWCDVPSLAAAVKHWVIPLQSPRPIAEAISSAGGVCWSELNDHLMIHNHPGLFVAGEMIDWDAPTGGYLMQACFATGTRAANGAAKWAHHPEI